MTLVKQISKQIKPLRAGVIVYLDEDSTRYFGMGIDTQSGDLTDFAGHVEYERFHESAIEGALREFNEESLGVFGDLAPEDIFNCKTIFTKRDMVVFIDVEGSREQYDIDFKSKFDTEILSGILPEVRGIVWLDTDKFKFLVNTKGKIFERVRKFLLSSLSVVDSLPQQKSCDTNENKCME